MLRDSNDGAASIPWYALQEESGPCTDEGDRTLREMELTNPARSSGSWTLRVKQHESR